MIYIIITSYGENISTEKAINSILLQKVTSQFKIIVCDPFTETKWMIEEKFPDNKKIEYFEDEDKGKSYALNMILKKIYSKNINDIFIFTDGDVYLRNNSIKEIVKKFEYSEVGCVCGRPMPLNPRKNMFGYWAHLSFDEMNKTRKKLAREEKFFEVSGYLFAIRNGIIDSFPIGASEDNVIPALIWKKGYRIDYAEDAHVFVMGPRSFREWTTQKKRNIKGHMTIKKTIGTFSYRKNTVFQEAFRGISYLFSHPKTVREFFWFIFMAFARLYAWVLAFYETRILKKAYSDGWRAYEKLTTTKPF